MPGQPLRIGPFIGGLNTTSDPTAIADAELVECTNLELDIDGSLISRPPVQEVDGHASWTQRVICIGEATFNGVSYLIGSDPSGVYYSESGTGAWTLITSTFQSYVAVQYANFLYMVPEPGAANPGGKWSPSGGFTAVAAIPQGMSAAVNKERLFVVPGRDSTSDESRLKFSDAGDFETFDAASFIDIGQGDGTKLLDLTVFQDNLILFKNNSTYSLSYDVRPSDAIVRRISDTIGVDRQYCVLNYENQVYTFHNGWVYEIINYDFNRLNTKVPFEKDETTPSAFADECVFLSLIGDRLICRYFNKIYIYGLRTRKWSEWDMSEDRLHYFGPIQILHGSSGNSFYSGSCLTAHLTVLKFIDKQTSTDIEEVDDPTRGITDTCSTVVVDGWGTADTGETWSVTSTATQFAKNGTKALVNTSSLDTFNLGVLDCNLLNPDYIVEFAHSVVPTGAGAVFSFRLRQQDANNFYRARVEITTAGAVNMRLEKNVAGVMTILTGVFTLGTVYTANLTLKIRMSLNGSTLRAKLWVASNPQPGAWNLSVSDSDIAVAGDIAYGIFLFGGTTNPLPVQTSFDNLTAGEATATSRTITCTLTTKNFDMAISHQFKRLWWWGADVSTNNTVIGTATPIIVNFSVTWGQLAAYTWGDLASNTWGQPLTTASSVETEVSTSTGTARRFVKFMKGLRYRQINFSLELTTDGSTADGPVRVFTLTLITETKQTVSESVS